MVNLIPHNERLEQEIIKYRQLIISKYPDQIRHQIASRRVAWRQFGPLKLTRRERIEVEMIELPFTLNGLRAAFVTVDEDGPIEIATEIGHELVMIPFDTWVTKLSASGNDEENIGHMVDMHRAFDNALGSPR